MNLDISLVAGIVAVLLVLAVTLFVLKRRKKEELSSGRSSEAPQRESAATPEPSPRSAGAPSAAPTGLGGKLGRTRAGLFGKLSGLLTRSGGLNEAEWEAVEEALLAGDVGVKVVDTLLTRLKTRLKENPGEMRKIVVEEGESILSGPDHGAKSFEGLPRPYVISIVGINGVGKTTTIGKLAKRFSDQGLKVLLGAGDTFRAAAIQQLKVWADRSQADFVTGREGADPGAVAFDALTAAKARGKDVVLFDTAGRLHTKSNLMEELKKIHRVMKKVIPEAPHETWLIVDGTLGQNSLGQAIEFKKTLDLSGLIVTKLDGTAKGGALLGISSELRLPIRYIGVGEGVEDLIPFEPKPFVEAILGEN